MSRKHSTSVSPDLRLCGLEACLPCVESDAWSRSREMVIFGIRVCTLLTSILPGNDPRLGGQIF